MDLQVGSSFTFKREYGVILFPIVTSFIAANYLEIPDVVEWDLIIILILIATLDRLGMKTFSTIRFASFLIIIGTLIFEGKIFYYLFYPIFMFDHARLWLKRKANLLIIVLPSISVHLLILIAGDLIYRQFLDPNYLERYILLFCLEAVNIVLVLAYFTLLTWRFSTAPFLSSFVPTLFEVLIIFPVLAIFDSFNFYIVLVLLIINYLFMKTCHNRLMSITQQHVRMLIEELEVNSGIKTIIIDLKDAKGMFVPDKNLIIIDEKLDYPEQLQTLIHEFIHYKFRGRVYLPKPIEELVVTILEAVYSWGYIFKISNKR